MYRNSTSWTEEEDAELWHLASQGISRMRLSVRLRRTERAIQSRMTLLRKKHRQAPLAGQHSTSKERRVSGQAACRHSNCGASLAPD